jgi:hypothetical protein
VVQSNNNNRASLKSRKTLSSKISLDEIPRNAIALGKNKNKNKNKIK